MIDDWMNDSESDEMVALFQDEIARLENEVRLRDEALAAAVGAAAPGDPAVDRDRERRLADLVKEIATRDETVGLLLDQIRLFEEAEVTAKAEWEQLHKWLSEVERRVETRDTEGDGLQLELEAERQRAEARRVAAENDRREWDGQRARLEQEVAELRKSLATVAARDSASDAEAAAAALDALEHENRRLRDTCHSLVRSSAQAAEAGRLRVEWNASQVQLEEARRELRQSLDDRDRERKEFEAELAAARAQRAREALCEEAPTPTPLAAAFPETQLDDRIRALRQHLREIHDDEQKERAQNRFTARLSRLWRHTSPTH